MSAGDVDQWETRPCEPRVSNEDAEDWYAVAQWESDRADRWKDEVAALRRQVEERCDVVTVPREEWAVAQILANAWSRHPLTCGERDKLVAEWDALRSGAAEQKRLAQVEAEAEEEKGRKA